MANFESFYSLNFGIPRAPEPVRWNEGLVRNRDMIRTQAATNALQFGPCVSLESGTNNSDCLPQKPSLGVGDSEVGETKEKVQVVHFKVVLKIDQKGT